MGSVPEHYPDYLIDLVNALRDALANAGIKNADEISLDLVEVIRNRFRGGYIYLPMFTAQEKNKRNSEIRRLLASGMSRREIAWRLGVTVPNVYMIAPVNKRTPTK